MSEDSHFPDHIDVNEGSRARDHLANERTFLAWVRTGLALVALGVAVSQFLTGTSATRDLSGALLVVAGTVIFFYSTWRYVRVKRQLDRGMFGSDVLGPIFTFSLVFAAAIAALFVVIAR